MSGELHCHSCGMPIENGVYCQHCVDEDGNLQDFDQRLERMMQWVLRREPGISREEAERQTRAYMRTMPAWRDRAELQEE